MTSKSLSRSLHRRICSRSWSNWQTFAVDEIGCSNYSWPRALPHFFFRFFLPLSSLPLFAKTTPNPPPPPPTRRIYSHFHHAAHTSSRYLWLIATAIASATTQIHLRLLTSLDVTVLHIHLPPFRSSAICSFFQPIFYCAAGARDSRGAFCRREYFIFICWIFPMANGKTNKFISVKLIRLELSDIRYLYYIEYVPNWVRCVVNWSVCIVSIIANCVNFIMIARARKTSTFCNL